LTKRVPVRGNAQRARESGSPAGADRQGKSLLSCRAEPGAESRQEQSRSPGTDSRH